MLLQNKCWRKSCCLDESAGKDRLSEAIWREYPLPGSGLRCPGAGKSNENSANTGGECLRLFVADSNIPAIHFYEKNGFARAPGHYDEVFADDCSALREYGYEMAV